MATPAVVSSLVSSALAPTVVSSIASESSLVSPALASVVSTVSGAALAA